MITLLLGVIVGISISFASIHYVFMPLVRNYPQIFDVLKRFEFIELTLICLLFSILFPGWLQIMKSTIYKTFIFYFYSLYSIFLFMMLFCKIKYHHQIVLIPFEFFRFNIRHIMEAALNLIYFVPLGILYRNFLCWKNLLFIGIIFIVGIETMQYLLFIGAFQTEDIIMNLSGIIIGALIVEKYMKRFTFI